MNIYSFLLGAAAGGLFTIVILAVTNSLQAPTSSLRSRDYKMRYGSVARMLTESPIDKSEVQRIARERNQLHATKYVMEHESVPLKVAAEFVREVVSQGKVTGR